MPNTHLNIATILSILPCLGSTQKARYSKFSEVFLKISTPRNLNGPQQALKNPSDTLGQLFCLKSQLQKLYTEISP